MSLTVYGAMKLNALKNFKLVSGQLGLERRVTRTAILDYEFTGKVPEDIENQFAPGEFILSSMLYAYEDEDALLEAVRKLIGLKVSALAVKTIFFKKLPDSVRQLADEERFPIFLFDNSTFFEDVIAEITESVRTSDRLQQVEAKLDTLMYRDLSLSDIRVYSMELNRDFRKYVVCFYGKLKAGSEALSAERVHDAYQRNRFRGPENFLASYKGGLMLFLSGEEAELPIYQARLGDVLVHCGFALEDFKMGCSGVRDALEGLHGAVREAVWAQKVSEASSESLKAFGDAGIYRLLLPQRESIWSEGFQQEFLAPLRKQDAAAGAELMKTAVAYIGCTGNLKKTAEALFVHENTVRYRINNIHKLLCPQDSELAFYEQLSIAIRLYVLKNQNRCI